MSDLPTRFRSIFSGKNVISPTAHHHEFGASHQSIEGSNDQSFGLLFAAVFALLAAYLEWQGYLWWMAPLMLALVFSVLALTRPLVLAPLNRGWTKVGLLLGAVVAPILMAVIYFIVVTPTAILARLAGKDFLRLRREPTAATYWLPRGDQDCQAVERLRDQF